MSFSVNVSNSENVDKNVVFGTTNDWKSFNLDLNQLSEENKQLYQDFLSIIGLFVTVIIENGPSVIEDCTFITPQEVDIDINQIDFESLDISQKDKIVNFCNLLVNNAL